MNFLKIIIINKVFCIIIHLFEDNIIHKLYKPIHIINKMLYYYFKVIINLQVIKVF